MQRGETTYAGWSRWSAEGPRSTASSWVHSSQRPWDLNKDKQVWFWLLSMLLVKASQCWCYMKKNIGIYKSNPAIKPGKNLEWVWMMKAGGCRRTGFMDRPDRVPFLCWDLSFLCSPTKTTSLCLAPAGLRYGVTSSYVGTSAMSYISLFLLSYMALLVFLSLLLSRKLLLNPAEGQNDISQRQTLK